MPDLRAADHQCEQRVAERAKQKRCLESESRQQEKAREQWTRGRAGGVGKGREAGAVHPIADLRLHPARDRREQHA